MRNSFSYMIYCQSSMTLILATMNSNFLAQVRQVILLRPPNHKI